MKCYLIVNVIEGNSWNESRVNVKVILDEKLAKEFIRKSNSDSEKLDCEDFQIEEMELG